MSLDSRILLLLFIRGYRTSSRIDRRRRLLRTRFIALNSRSIDRQAMQYKYINARRGCGIGGFEYIIIICTEFTEKKKKTLCVCRFSHSVFPDLTVFFDLSRTRLY